MKVDNIFKRRTSSKHVSSIVNRSQHIFIIPDSVQHTLCLQHTHESGSYHQDLYPFSLGAGWIKGISHPVLVRNVTLLLLIRNLETWPQKAKGKIKIHY
jgi:hypothetical protein